MGHFHIQRKRNKKSHKTIQGRANKYSISNAEHNTKHNKARSTNRQKEQKWHLPNEAPRLPTEQSILNLKASGNNNSNSGYSSHINTGHTYGLMKMKTRTHWENIANTKSKKLTYTWMTQTVIHITKHSEHCGKQTSASRTTWDNQNSYCYRSLCETSCPTSWPPLL
jgi:hypothetical protein